MTKSNKTKGTKGDKINELFVQCGQTISSSAPAMAPSTAKGSPAPFLNGARGRLGRSMPLLEDDATTIDLRKDMEEEENNI